MKVLVINCGSSSLKFQLMDSSTENVIAKGICERIGLDGILVYQPLESEKIKINIDMPNHKVAFQAVMDALTGKENGVINSLDEIDAIGHRIVHGGEKFSHATLLSDEERKGVV